MRTTAKYSAAVALLMACGALAFAACSKTTTLSGDRGELMVAISTDLIPGKDITSFELTVTHHGTVQYDKSYTLGSGMSDTKLPATFGVSSGITDGDPVTVVVTASKNGTARVARTAIVSVPQDRTALLRMPIQWLCDGSAAGATAPAGSSLPCAAGNTCIAGACVPATIDVVSLPTFQPSAVFGTSCFPTSSCFAGAMPAQTMNPPCGVRDGNSTYLNTEYLIALPPGSDGDCSDGGEYDGAPHCFVALEQDPTFGFYADPMQQFYIDLPSAACGLALGGVGEVWYSRTCAARPPNDPICSAGTMVGIDADSGVNDGGAVEDGSVANAVTVSGAPGCLAVDSTNLYVATKSTLYSMPKAGGAQKAIAIGGTAISTCVSDGSYVYFVDGTTVLYVPTSGGTPTTLGMVSGTTVRLAVTATTVYATDESPVLHAFGVPNQTPSSVPTIMQTSNSILRGLTLDPSDNVYVLSCDQMDAGTVSTLFQIPGDGGASVAGNEVTSEVDDIAYGNTVIYGTLPTGAIGDVPSTKSTPSPMPMPVTSGLTAAPGYRIPLVTVRSGGEVFWANGPSVVSLAGPAQNTLATAAAPIAFLAVDDSKVYYVTVADSAGVAHVGGVTYPTPAP